MVLVVANLKAKNRIKYKTTTTFYHYSKKAIKIVEINTHKRFFEDIHKIIEMQNMPKNMLQTEAVRWLSVKAF